MDTDNELKRLEDELRLLEDSLWYINWAIRFSISAFIAEVVVFVELFRNNLSAALEVLGISLILMGISFYLRDKSHKCFRRANGNE